MNKFQNTQDLPKFGQVSWEIAKWMKCLPRKHGDQSGDPSDPQKSQTT